MVKTVATMIPNSQASYAANRCPFLAAQRRAVLFSIQSVTTRRPELLRSNSTRLPDTHLTSSIKALEVLQGNEQINRYLTEKRNSLVAMGITVQNCPVAIREKLAIPEAEWPRAIDELTTYPHLEEAAVLSTCNRMEVYVMALSWHRGVKEIEDWLCRASGVPIEELRPHLFLLKDRDATAHLFSVAGGLESMVLGEGQILSQIKQVYKVGQNCNGFGRHLNGLLKQAITAGKRVRNETSICSGAVSISSAAAELAQLKLPTHDFTDANICIIGAGRMSILLIKHLVSKGCKKISILNRSLARAEALAEQFPEVEFDIHLMKDLLVCVEACDVIFAASSSEEILLNKSQVQQMTRVNERVGGVRRFFDISVPRNISNCINELEANRVFNVDSLQEVVAANKTERTKAAKEAEELIHQEIQSFEAWRDSLETVPAIKALRGKAEEIRSSELEKALNKCGDGLTKKQLKALEDMSRGIVNKLLHGPMTALRCDGADPKAVGQTLANMDALERMFGLSHVEFQTHFLDNIRTKSLCGMEASGADGSHLWRVPTEIPITTNLEAGTLLNATWNLHYPHQGGWRFALFDSDGRQVMSWAGEDHWGCNYDGTQQWTQLMLPSEPCRNCVLRLERQALEWGRTYLFRSCARVNLVESNPCNGCSGNGQCVQGKCQCFTDPERGFWEGTYCERQNECEVDSHCGTGGICIDTKATTPPRKQCYCKTGWFGKETFPWLPESRLPIRKCDSRSSLIMDDIEEWNERYLNKRVSSPSGAFELFYKVDQTKGYVEYAIKARTESWIGVGIRPVSSSSSNSLDALVEAFSEAESEGEAFSEAHSEGEAFSEAESEGEASSEGVPSSSGSSCDEGPYFALFDEGKLNDVSSASAPGSSRKLSSVTFPSLDPEAVVDGSKTGYDGWSFRGLRSDEATAEAETVSETQTTAEVEPEPHSEAEAEVEPESHAEAESGVEPEPHTEAESEVEPEAHGEGEPSTSKQKKSSKMVYFGEGNCRNVLVSDPNAHPMINQDVVVGLAKGNSFRIQDAYTPSRARPLPDSHFGGQDDITDAIGFEAEGYTYMKFTKPLETSDTVADYCLLPGVNYLMIYAIGQTPESYYHRPSSSLEVGKAGNEGFYGTDELKFHGGGIGTTHENRGSFGLINFFQSQQEQSESCTKSTLGSYDCMEEVIPNGLSIHWTTEADRVKLAAEASTTGWIGIAWPETPGQMIGAKALIASTPVGAESQIGFYELNSKAVSGVVAIQDPFRINDATVSAQNGKTVLEFSRLFDEEFGREDTHDLLVAYHTNDALAYHGINRAPLQLNFKSSSNKPSGNESQKRSLVNPKTDKEAAGCQKSELEGFDCSTDVLSGVKLHWKVDVSSVSFAMEAPGDGWVALAWPETPGNMVPSEAVIGTNTDLGVYKLTGKSTNDIIPDSSLFSITEARSESSNGQLLMQFARELDDQFTATGEVPLLVAFDPDSSELSYHGFSNRAALELNLQTGALESSSTATAKAEFYDAHALLMAISWGVMIPLGVLIARTLKDLDPLWFRLHKLLQVVGLMGAIAGYVIALLKFETSDDFRHRQVGLVIMILGIFQPLNALVRPKHGSFLRVPWQWLHMCIGRCAVILAMYNIYTGLDAYEVLRQVGSKKWHFRFGMWLIAIVLTYLVLESRASGIRSRKKQEEKEIQPELAPPRSSHAGEFATV
eukprot:g2593.t1